MSGATARLLVAGGGTGGHLFPALAVAEAWEGLNPGGEVLFVGTPRGLEARLVPQRGKRLALLQVGQLQGGGVVGRLATLAGLPRAVWQAWRIIGGFRPQVVLGVGGYVSAPAVVAARLRGIPVVLHEQNAFPGLANRWLRRLAREVCVAFAEAAPRFAGTPVTVTGNPVRGELLELPEGEWGTEGDGVATLLVFGGSQGARILARVVPEAVALMVREGGPRVRVVQQARREDLEGVRGIYQRAGVEAVVHAFIDDMGAAYGGAALVICRSGASTLAELAVVGRPALMVPLPNAADDHQTHNARAMVAAGGGWLRHQEEFEPVWLAGFLRERLTDRGALAAAGSRARALARRDAAPAIARRLMAQVQSTGK